MKCLATASHDMYIGIYVYEHIYIYICICKGIYVDIFI